jgi:hypothetical protein
VQQGRSEKYQHFGQTAVLNQTSEGVKYCSNIQSVRVELLLANILS